MYSAKKCLIDLLSVLSEVFTLDADMHRDVEHFLGVTELGVHFVVFDAYATDNGGLLLKFSNAPTLNLQAREARERTVRKSWRCKGSMVPSNLLGAI